MSTVVKVHTQRLLTSIIPVPFVGFCLATTVVPTRLAVKSCTTLMGHLAGRGCLRTFRGYADGIEELVRQGQGREMGPCLSARARSPQRQDRNSIGCSPRAYLRFASTAMVREGARLADLGGDVGQALVWYRKFLDLFVAADPEFSDLLESMRARVAELETQLAER